MFSFFKKKSKDTPATQQEITADTSKQASVPPANPSIEQSQQSELTPATTEPVAAEQKQSWLNLFKKESPLAPADAATISVAASTPEPEGEIIPAAPQPIEQKQSWMKRLKAGLSKTSTNLTTLFVGAKIDDDLYEELESALLMSDAGVEATQALLDALKKKVKSEKLTEAQQV
ncbi:MAG TPA: signal recognition particle receptor subunit alpha, partial [Noviherbaspirillum sp.]|nr:signal recognition particle receptor subunit alpha [Noviherbaspirillum sp.]